MKGIKTKKEAERMKKRLFAFIAATLILVAAALGTTTVSADNCPPPFSYSYQNTGDMRSDIVQHALSQVGYHEGPNGWNAFGNSFGNSSGSWCAYFVQWCARRANVPTSVIPESTLGRVADYWENSNAALEFHPVNDYANPYTPKAGDLVIYRNVQTYYDRNTNSITTWPTSDSFACRFGMSGSSRASHIGIVTRDAAYPTNNGSSINYAGFCMVDGNWHGAVASRFELYSNITGFVSIKYPETGGTPGPSTGTWPILKKGSSGTNVAVLQTMLNSTIGAGLDVDGNFGTNTAIAVMRFQTWNGITVDGCVGPETWTSLARKNVQSKLSYDYAVTRQLQTLLNYRFGITTSVDGHFGPKTEVSVKTFQSRAGLIADGKVGPDTWRMLISGR